MKNILVILLGVSGIVSVNALVVSEVMSNPTGDDSGREWIEVFNDTSSPVDLSSMTVSIKGGTAVVATPLQGGTSLPAGGYAIIGSVVSGATKFLQDYPSYSGILFKSAISLVNTGTTSIDIKLGGTTVASLTSYTAAKEGYTLSYIGGNYVLGNPTPGTDNQAADTTSSSSSGSSSSSSTTTDSQVVLPQATPPSPNIVIYLPVEKTVVAGAESDYSVFAQTREGKSLNDLLYTWAFGDGGQATGSSTTYKYFYSGRYIAQVEARSASVFGTGRMVVRVVAPDIEITGVGAGKYGSYVEIHNPNDYELDLSSWILNIDGAGYPFPKNTLLPANAITRFSGGAMGFATREINSSSTVRIMFPNFEEVTRYTAQPQQVVIAPTAPSSPMTQPKKIVSKIPVKQVLGVSTTTLTQTSSTSIPVSNFSFTKDTRLVHWLKSLF